MSILGTIFGSKKVLKAGLDIIDGLHTSDEERAGFKLKFLGMYEAFKVAQRWLMMILAIPFVTVHVVACGMWLRAIWALMDMERYKFVVAELGKVVTMNNAALGEPLSWFVIFYAGGGAAEGAIKRFMKHKESK